MIIPNMTLRNTLIQLISIVVSDYNAKVAASLESESWLYRTFNDTVYGNFDFYQQAINVIVNRDNKNYRKLEVRHEFDPSKAATPSIFINTPSEDQDGENTIGLNMDTGSYYDNSDGTTNDTYSRTFRGTYEIMITSDNSMEVELIYRFLQAIFISSADTLNDIFSGTFSFSGKSVMANPNLINYPLFIKTWTVRVDNKITAPVLPITEYLGKVKFIDVEQTEQTEQNTEGSDILER